MFEFAGLTETRHLEVWSRGTDSSGRLPCLPGSWVRMHTARGVLKKEVFARVLWEKMRLGDLSGLFA